LFHPKIQLPEPGRDAEVFGFHVHLRGPHEETEVVPGRGGENLRNDGSNDGLDGDVGGKSEKFGWFEMVLLDDFTR